MQVISTNPTLGSTISPKEW